MPLLPPHELLDERHVWIDAVASLFDSLVAFLVGNSFGEDHVGDADGGRTRDALDAVHVDFAT